jgi:hypothetical protein
MNAADFSRLWNGKSLSILFAATWIFLMPEATSTATAQDVTLLPSPNTDRPFRLEMPKGYWDTIKALNKAEKAETGGLPYAHTDFFIDAKSGQVEVTTEDQVLFPLELMFAPNIAERCLSIEIVNRSSDNLLIDWEAVKAIQLVYWFQAEGRMKASGYTTALQLPIPLEQLNDPLATPVRRFVSLPPGKSIGHIKKSLNDLLSEVRPYAPKIEDFVGIQLFGTGLSVAVVKNGKAIFDDRLYRALTSGKPKMLSKQDLDQLLNIDQ